MNYLVEHRKTIILVGIGVIGIAALLVLALAGAMLLQPIFSSNQLMLANLDQSNEVDLYLLQLGQPEKKAFLLARNVEMSPLLFLTIGDGMPQMLGNYPIISLGGFVPDSNYLLYWYLDDDKTVVNRMRDSGGEPVLIFDSKSQDIAGVVLERSDTVFLAEKMDDGSMRCYISVSGEEADRVGKGTACDLSDDGTRLLVTDTEDSGATTVNISDISGENEITLLDEEEGVSSVRFSSDGTRVAYLKESDDKSRVIVLDARNGDVISESDEFLSVVSFDFSAHRKSFYYIGEDDEGELTLYVLEGDKPARVASGFIMIAAFNPSGEYLVYLAGDKDGEMILSVHSMSGGKDVEVLKADSIQYQILNDPDRILAMQVTDDELTISSAPISGGEPVELYSDNDISLAAAYYLPGENQLYLLLSSEDGLSLFTTPLDQEDAGFMLVEDWVEVQLLNRGRDGKMVVFAGRESEDDDPALYISKAEEKSRPEVLDDDDTEAILNAVFVPNGKEVLYTVLTGTDSDQVEIRQVRADGEERYDVVYEDDLLVDVRWDYLSPFSLFMGLATGNGALTWNEALNGITYCPGAEMLAVGARINGMLDPGEKACYRVELDAGQMYIFTVDSKVDTGLELYNQVGVGIVGDDDSGSSSNALIRTKVDENGTYFVVVEGPEDIPASFLILLREGVGDPGFDNAILLEEGSSVRGAITSSTRLTLESIGYSTYGKMYYFEGEMGDQVAIDVFGPSIGSEIDPIVSLYNQYLTKLGSDDDSGSGYDSRLTYVLPEDGRYFILVESVGKHYGDSDNYYYQVKLTK